MNVFGAGITTLRSLALIVALVPAVFPAGALAQDVPVQTKVLAESVIDISTDPTITVQRMYLTEFDRSESLLLGEDVLMIVEEGQAKIWTRRGAIVNGTPVEDSTATLYVEEGATFSAPPETRFRVRSRSCEPLRLLFIMVSE